MGCIIWTLLRANNVRGNAWSPGWSALSGVLMVFVFIGVKAFLCDFLLTTWLCVVILFLFFLFFFVVLLVTLCFHHRCSPGRRVVYSHTPSSTKTTQAVQTSWTSSSMEENSSKRFCWTLWVRSTLTRPSFCLAHSETHLTGVVNWSLNEGRENHSAVTRGTMSSLCFLFFFLLWKLLFLELHFLDYKSTMSAPAVALNSVQIVAFLEV